jgi:hypothetical protein
MLNNAEEIHGELTFETLLLRVLRMKLGALFWGFAALAGAGCSNDDFSGGQGAGSGGAQSAGAAGQASGRGGSSGSAGEAGSEPGEACEEGATRECFGPAACHGGQVCGEGSWSACDCGTSPASGGSGGSGAAGGASGSGQGGGGNQPGGGEAGTTEPGDACLRATGSITIGVGTLLDTHGDTFTLGDGVNADVTFEFDWNDDGTTVNGDNVIPFSGTPSTAELATAITNAINAAAALNITATKIVEESGAGGEGSEPTAPTAAVVQLKNDRTGERGNVAISETVGNPNFKVSGMSGGSGTSCP